MNEFYVVIDAGHGGDDPGTVGNGVLEKDLTLKISQYMYDRFKELGVPVKMTRTTDETLDSKERVRRILNSFGDNPNVIVISNHINSSGTPNTAEGAEVIYALRNEDTLAKNILNAFAREGQVVRKVYQRRLTSNPNKDYYFIHRETGRTQPVIIEYGFINNEEDINRIQNNYKRYVDAIVDAVIQTMGSGSDSDVHIVKAGDTLWSIAKMHNLTVEQLKKLNGLTNNIISIGQVLKVSDGESDTTLTTYTVKPGDTLWKIANMYNTTVDNLKIINNLDTNLLSIGQNLLIKEDYNNENEYVVKAGDSLWKIAKEYNVTVEDLKNANNLNSNVIFIGQVLKIPQSRVEMVKASYIYGVKKGDTLWNIAKMNNTTVEKIMELNGLTSDMLVVGQLLLIP